eukprot:GGOE01022282.1.p1 GENE.GGOE01022282.1~~GGOE01022282.1.p1  ORF type:complete len:238 (-),score=83.57 GGOE01022282.1:302-958(-)
MRPAIQKPSTRQHLLTTTAAKSFPISPLADEVGCAHGPPQLVPVDFQKFIDNSVNAKMKAVQPAYALDDRALFREITNRFYAKGPNLRFMFNEISRLEPPNTKPGHPQRISLEQFRFRLQEWGMRFSLGQLRRIFESFEEVPGKGLTYTAFTQLVNEMSREDIEKNRLLNLFLMERFAACDKVSHLASTCLLPTEDQAKEIEWHKVKTAPLYASRYGL